MKVGIRVGKRKKFYVVAVHVNGDWAVTRSVYATMDKHLKEAYETDPDLYRVTHIPSGYAMPHKDNLWSGETAIRMADRMSVCPVKWNGKGKVPREFVDAVRPLWEQLKKEEGLT